MDKLILKKSHGGKLLRPDRRRQCVHELEKKVEISQQRAFKVTEDGSEVTLDFRKAGDFVGENMLTEDLVYPFNAWCIEDVITCGLSKNQFQDIILKYPEIGLQIIKSMSEKISWLTN